jgi:lipopolysaccharide exporter
MTLRSQTFSGVRWTTFSSLGRTALQIVQVAILARLLTPADFGLFAVVLAIMAFLQIFADAGISNAIIHYQDITQKQLSSLYWLNVSASLLLATLVAVTSPWLSNWYHEPLLQYLLMLAATTLVASSLGQQIKVVAQKNLLFAKLAKVELIAAFFGFIAAICLAWLDAGVFSMIIGSLVTAVISSLLLWALLSEGWRPKLRLQLGEIRKFLKFGAYMVGNNLANTFNMQIDILLGTRLLGAQLIGMYSLPKELSLRIAGVINPIITQVGLPIMASAQGNTPLLKRIYLQTIRMTASINFPAYVSLAIFAPEIVRLILGEKWLPAIPLLQIFACWALLRSIGNPAGILLMARGRADLSFKWNMLLLLIMPPTIWIGSQFGIMGMAVAMATIGVVLYIPSWYFLIRPLCGATLGEYSMQMAVPLVLSILAGVISYLSVYFWEDNLLRLSIGVPVGGLVYVGLSWRFNRVWVDAMIELGLFKK